MLNLWLQYGLRLIVPMLLTLCISGNSMIDTTMFHGEEVFNLFTMANATMQGHTNSKEQIFLLEGEYYAYAPSVVKEGDTYHVFYCSNARKGKIKDSIYYRRCVKTDTGFIYSKPVEVLSAGNGWDSMHVCDPSVIAGDFMYQNTSYQYLMAYLGCSSTDNQDNKIGFALSNDCLNWNKVENLCISETFDEQSDAFQWGVGQPSVLTTAEGRLLLFYTSGSADLTCEKIKIFEDGNFDQLKEAGEFAIRNMAGDFISNADFAWNGGQLVTVCDRHPFSEGTLSDISDASDIYTADISSYEDLVSVEWKYIAGIDSCVTGFDKNHNACLVRDWNGCYQREVVLSVATQKQNYIKSLWTYRLYFIEY